MAEYIDVESKTESDTVAKLYSSPNLMQNYENEEEDEGEDLKYDSEVVAVWFEDFSKSSYFPDLPERAQKFANIIVESFADFMFQHRKELPEDWSRQNTYIVCTQTMPSMIPSKDDSYEEVVPVLNSFFKFLADAKYLAQGFELAEEVKNLGPEIVAAFSNPKNWSFGKTIAMNGLKAGFDIQDKEQRSIYMDSVTDKLFSSFSQIAEEIIAYESKKAKRKLQKKSRRKNRH